MRIKTGLLILFALWVVLAVIFAFTDLQISIAFVNYQSEWAKFLEDWGGYPGALAYISSFIVLVLNLFSYFKEKFRNTPQILIFAKITLCIAVINVLCFVSLTQYFWGRVRFYNLDSTFSQFSPWYLPQSPNGHNSFVSGHAAEGWLLIALGPILLKGKNRIIKTFITSLTILWGVAVALSRIRLGAHYASDVLFSSCFGILLFLLLYNHFSNQLEKGLVTDPKQENQF